MPYLYGCFYKESRDGQDWIAGRRWPRFSSYTFTEKDGRTHIETEGQPVDWYFLDSSPAVEGALFADFCNIEDQETCYHFLELWGFPVDSHYPSLEVQFIEGQTGLDYILASAATMRFLRVLFQTSRDNPMLLREFACLRRGFVGANFKGPDELQRMRDEFKKLQESGPEPGEAVVQFEFHPTDLSQWQGYWGAKAPDYDRALTPLRRLSVEVSREDWLRNPDEALQQAANKFLVCTVDELMSSIRQGIVISQAGDENALFEPVIKVREPWEDVVYGLYRELTGAATVRTCPHPDCGKTFVAKRKSKMSCGEERCQQWVTRNKKKKQEGKR